MGNQAPSLLLLVELFVYIYFLGEAGNIEISQNWFFLWHFEVEVGKEVAGVLQPDFTGATGVYPALAKLGNETGRDRTSTEHSTEVLS